MRVIVVGAGASGIFAAIAAAEAGATVAVLEAGKAPLQKVRISGGGRCNVSTGVTDLRALLQHYPRGAKELRGPLRRFGPAWVQSWFSQRGVALKTEADGRVFPCSDDSGTIIDCLLAAADAAGVELRLSWPVTAINRIGSGFRVVGRGAELEAERVLLATGGGRPGLALARSLGHRLVDPVPSLFTFTVPEAWLRALSGLSVPQARVAVDGLGEPLRAEGPLLITHWGLSGPAVLRASAWGARLLAASEYRGALRIDWTGAGDQALRQAVQAERDAGGRRLVQGQPLAGLPKRLWQALCQRAAVPAERCWAELTKAERNGLIEQCCACPLPLAGKGRFKEEFVTAGGVCRDEVDWQAMASRVCPGLHLAGELIDIDGITGGFNFSAAWATGRVAGEALAS